MFNNTSDLVIYEFETVSNIKLMVCYIEGFIDKDLLDKDIIKPIILNLDNPKDIEKIIYISGMEESSSLQEVADNMIYGSVALFIDRISKCYIISLNCWEKRAIEEPPQAEAVVRGSKEGFIEDLTTNKVMIRRRIRNNDLVFEDYIIGKETKTKISIAYIQGIVNENILKEVKKRIDNIDIDGILESGYMVIIVAATAIAEFAVPPLTESIIIYRFVFIFFRRIHGFICYNLWAYHDNNSYYIIKFFWCSLCFSFSSWKQTRP